MFKKAFTLIELLVVIAIIAILAAILFPVFAQAKVAAKKAASLSNEKQDALGVIMYANDNDDAFPLIYTPFPNGAVDQFVGATYTWQNLVQPYVKNWGVFVSPLSKFPHADPVNTNDPFFNYGMLPVSGIHGIPQFGDTYYAPAGIGTATVGWNGIGGAVNDTAGGPNESWVSSGNGNVWTVPSLTASGISSSADTLMTSDGNAPDDWVIYFGPGGIDNDTFHYCVSWSGVLPGWMRFGPVTRSGGQQATDCGHMRAYNGQNTSSFTDGHAKSQAILQLMQTSTLSSGQLVYTHLWPAGVN